MQFVDLVVNADLFGNAYSIGIQIRSVMQILQIWSVMLISQNFPKKISIDKDRPNTGPIWPSNGSTKVKLIFPGLSRNFFVELGHDEGHLYINLFYIMT